MPIDAPNAFVPPVEYPRCPTTAGPTRLGWIARCAPILVVAFSLSPDRSHAQVSATVQATFQSSSVGHSGTTALDTGDVGPDAANFARAVADPYAGTVGVGAATDLVAGTVPFLQAGASASLEDSWSASCGVQHDQVCAGIPHAATMQFHLHGVLGPDWNDPDTLNSGFLAEEIDIAGLRVVLGIAEPFTIEQGMSGAFSVNGGPSTPIFIVPTLLNNGSLSFDETFSVDASLDNTFGSSLSLRANWSGEGFLAAPTSADFLDTASFDIVSLDPNVAWTSAGGRSSIVAATVIPEPATPFLVAIGLGLAMARRSARKRTVAA